MSTYNAIRYNVDYANVGSLKLLSTQTASSSASVSFTTGIDSTYDEYWILVQDAHPANNDVHLQFQASTNSGSSYGVTCTNTNFRASHNESDTFTTLAYLSSNDVAQSTSFFIINEGCGNASDASCVGIIKLYNPSSTTYVKHYTSEFNGMNFQSPPQTPHYFTAGYFNTTSAVDAVQFKMSSGNIDDGTFQLFGVKQ